MNAYAIFVVNEHIQVLLDEAAAHRTLPRRQARTSQADRLRCILGQGGHLGPRRLQPVDPPDAQRLPVPELRPPPLGFADLPPIHERPPVPPPGVVVCPPHAPGITLADGQHSHVESRHGAPPDPRHPRRCRPGPRDRVLSRRAGLDTGVDRRRGGVLRPRRPGPRPLAASRLAADSGLSPDGLGAYHGFALAQNLRSREEVDALFAQLRERGVDIAKPPVDTDWGGYSGYFTDPDGHHWEVAWNPFWPLRDDGRIELPTG